MHTSLCGLKMHFSQTGVVLTILSCCVAVAHGNLETEYNFKFVLRDDEQGTYVLYWKFDVATETIGFAVNASTRGWVGFGLSPNGGMPGSDVVIGWVKDDSVYFNVSA